MTIMTQNRGQAVDKCVGIPNLVQKPEKHEESYRFLKFHIQEFYSSIFAELLNRALKFELRQHLLKDHKGRSRNHQTHQGIHPLQQRQILGEEIEREIRCNCGKPRWCANF